MVRHVDVFRFRPSVIADDDGVSVYLPLGLEAKFSDMTIERDQPGTLFD